MKTDKIVDSKVTTMTDLSSNKSKVLLLKNETEIEAFKEQLRLYSVSGSACIDFAEWIRVRGYKPDGERTWTRKIAGKPLEIKNTNQLHKEYEHYR